MSIKNHGTEVKTVRRSIARLNSRGWTSALMPLGGARAGGVVGRR